MTTSPATSLARVAAAGLFCLLTSGCELNYPEVSITNGFSGGIQVSSIRFSGCAWTETLGAGQSTPPGGCLPGEEHVYYNLFDPEHPDLKWQGHQTHSLFQVKEGARLEVTLSESDDERDLTAPGPYGH